jgi:hypothetical protein
MIEMTVGHTLFIQARVRNVSHKIFIFYKE